MIKSLAKRSLTGYMLVLSAVAVAVGLGGPGALGAVPRASAVQAAASPVSGSCAPPCGTDQTLQTTALPLLRARQTAGMRVTAQVRLKPQPARLKSRSGAAFTIDGHPYRVVRTLSMIASAYGHPEPGVGRITFSGTQVHVGEVAVDPRVIPLGTWLYITGYRTPYLPNAGLLAQAQDTGGAIKGRRVDIYMYAPLHAYAVFGLQPVHVEVLAPVH